MRKEEPGVSVNLPWFSKNAAALGAVALSVGVLAACSSSGSSTTSGSTSSSTGTSTNASGPITIGTSLSLTGDFSTDGISYEQGYELWEKDVNAAGGIDGRQVKITFLDDASSANQVVTNYDTLINTDHVDLTFGPFSSLLTAPASAVAARNGYAFVEGAGGAPSVFDSPSNQADHNVFDVSYPVAVSLVPFVNYIRSLGAAADKKLTVAFPQAQDPFATAPVSLAETQLDQLGVDNVYDKTFPEEPSDYDAPAQNVAEKHPDIVVLGSTDAQTVAAFMKVFQQNHYTPKLFIAAGGPDEGSQFISAVGAGNAAGMMVPDGWYPGVKNAASEKMVAEYDAQYHTSASAISPDIAEAYSVGQVVAQAIKATGGTSNSAIIKYLHSGVTLNSVQGAVQFNALGENEKAIIFTFQWDKSGTGFNEVLPTIAGESVPLITTKPPWTGAITGSSSS
jgi:branched-chain amino acid transport system substrate-binding protein